MGNSKARVYGFFCLVILASGVYALRYAYIHGYTKVSSDPLLLVPVDINSKKPSPQLSCTTVTSKLQEDNGNGTLANSSMQAIISQKVIKMASKMNGEFVDEFFEGCEFSNCTLLFSDKLTDVTKADVVVEEFNSNLIETIIKSYIQPRQSFIVFGHESPGFSHNRWKTTINKVDSTMTYSRNSAVHYTWGEAILLQKNKSKSLDYSQGKTRGAFAYVSNCDSMQYKRLQVMKELSKHIQTDIYGQCTKRIPCPRFKPACEASVHSKYRFYLAFENSLCKDYITEKFWKTLQSDGHFIPVVIGGLSIEDYSSIAPPDSFIHAYNFTSIAELGKYLSYLMEDDTAYNRYHQWKSHYRITLDPCKASCDLCKIANNPGLLKQFKNQSFADDWNTPNNCRTLSNSFT